jgi:type II secretory pathway pseudopilin PulG
MNRQHNNESGMTLLELMLAGGVIALALTFVFGSLVTISMAGNLTQDRGVGVTHLATVMEELKGLTYAELLAYRPPTFQGLGPGETVAVDCYQDDDTPLRLPVNPASLVNPLPNPLRVQCTVTWHDERGHNFRITGSELYYQ